MKKLFPLLCAFALLAACGKNDNDPRYLTLDFEGSEVPLAGPTALGDNLYANYDGDDKFEKYQDPTTGLVLELLPSSYYDDKPDFSAGGIAFSTWNYMTQDEIEEATTVVDDWSNQCSVYYKDGRDRGGHDSWTFSVAHCPAYEGPKTTLGFADPDKEMVFESMWVMNTTYVALTILEGNAFAGTPPLEDEKGWLLLTVEGFNAAGRSTGKEKFYLADFREGGDGLVTEWSKVELESLGKVNKLVFSLSGSDTGEYGLNTPAYFCLDDIKIRL